MNHVIDFRMLAGAEVCFAAASRLLYCEPSADEVAMQVLTRPYAEAPFATENQWASRGLGLMDDWDFQVQREAAEKLGDSPLTAEALVALPQFNERVDGLRREWLRLFAGVGIPEASCLESFYVEPNSHMFAKSTLAVRDAYRAYGLQIERLHSEPDDHLGLMLGFLSHLIGVEIEASESGEDKAAAKAAADQKSFLVQHVLPWLPVWRYSVEKYASSDFFRGVGLFVFGLTACYAERFSIIYNEQGQRFNQRQS